MLEVGLEPEDQAIAFAWTKELKLKNPVYCDDFLVANLVEIKRKNFHYFAHYQGRIHDSNYWLVGNPSLHRFHRNSIHTIPELYFVVVKILIVDDCTLKGNCVRKD